MQVPTAYAQAKERKYPEPVAIVIAKDAQSKYNPITLCWVMSTSHNPPMLAVSIGKTRWSLEAVRRSGEFVVSYPSAAMAGDARYYGERSGRAEDKLRAFGSRTQPAAAIDGVLLADAVANFECKLLCEHESGDHVIFVGQVVAAHVNQDPKVRRLYVVDKDYGMSGVVPG